jgi:carbamoylphosphate synthase large subunit
MRTAAKTLAQVKRLEQLTTETQKQLEKLAKVETPVTIKPAEDTGGTSGPKPTQYADLDAAYGEAKTDPAHKLVRVLTLAHNDPRRFAGRGEVSG